MILSNAEYIAIRDRKNFASLNDGSQTAAYTCKSKIVIYVGNRGCGKTRLILCRALPKISNGRYRAAYLRKEIKDSQGAGGIADQSKEVFSQFGNYLESVQSMVWKFNSGAKAVFMNYSAPLKEFCDSIQGKEFTDVNIDEITQMPETHFNALFAAMRNSAGLSTSVFGTCNSDANSWIAKLISWWIDPETGFHIPERDGVERFFFQYGETVSESFWGDSREEVYELAKDYIAPYWDKAYEKDGSVLDLIQSISVFEGKMHENRHLTGGAEYLGQLLKGTAEMRNSYARACWKKLDIGNALISESDMLNMFNNAYQTDGTRYASMDVCGEGSDKAVLYIWDGMHIINVYMTDGVDAKAIREWTIRHLNYERVAESNFIYDAIGVGYAFSGYFPDAKKFVSNAKVSEGSLVKGIDKQLMKIYHNAKAELVGKFIETLKDSNGSGECGISIEQDLLNKVFYNQTLREHLLHERKGIRWRSDKDGVKQCIDKKETIKIIGHSADIFMAIIYRMGLSIGHKQFVPMEDKNISNLQNFFLNY